MSTRKQRTPEPRPWKLLLWTAIAGLVFGLIGFGEIAEDYLRSTRNSLHPHHASGDIVLVLIDDQSLRQVGNWPWRRQQDAVLLDRLTAIGAKRIFMDINLSFPSTPQDDTALADALQRSGRVTLFSRSEVGQQKMLIRWYSG